MSKVNPVCQSCGNELPDRWILTICDRCNRKLIRTQKRIQARSAQEAMEQAPDFVPFASIPRDRTHSTRLF